MPRQFDRLQQAKYARLESLNLCLWLFQVEMFLVPTVFEKLYRIIKTKNSQNGGHLPGVELIKKVISSLYS